MNAIEQDSRGVRFELKTWACPICKGQNEKFLGFRGGKSHRYGYGIQSKIVKCKNCHLLYANPFPVPVEPQEIYGDPVSYFENHKEAKKIELDQNIIRKLIKMTNSQPRILDVGSGRGEMLVAARNEGAQAVGLEFSDAMIQEAKSRHQVEVLKMSIEQAANKWPGLYDAIILNAVLEHVYDPDSMIRSAVELLKVGGIIYLDIPNEPSLFTRVGNFAKRMVGSKTVYNLSPTWPPYHVYGFNQKALRKLFCKYNVAIEKVQVYASPKMKSGPKLLDKFLAAVGFSIKSIANLTGTASNMYVWARKL